MATCRSSVQVTDINGGVQTLVSQRVGERLADARTVLTSVSVGPFCTWVDDILFDNEATCIAGNFATDIVKLPVDNTAFFAWSCVAF